ncbi:MAG: MFS transporter [Candidatus Hodarchaeota archaeon]
MVTENSTDQYNVWRDYYLIIQGLFYLAQGVSMGALLFFTEFLNYLDVPKFERILFQAIIAFPWYLKIIFGVLSDNVKIRNYGRRKPYIFIAGIFGVIGWLTIPLFTEFNPILLFFGILASLATAMSDAVIDALAVDITPPIRRGAMQGVSWGSRGLGIGISAVVIGMLAEEELWFYVYAVPGIGVSLACFLVLLFQENPLAPDFKPVPIKKYINELKPEKVQLCMAFQILSGAGIAITAIIETFLREETDYSETDIGRVIAMFAVGMFIGAAVFGLLGDQISVRITLPVTTALYTAAIISVFLFDIEEFIAAALFFGLIGLMNGGYEATQMRIGMDIASTSESLEGTMYNLFNSISNIGQFALGSLLVAMLVELADDYKIGWQLCWLFLLLAMVPGYLLVKKAIDIKENMATN